jgi:hypothetical protein
MMYSQVLDRLHQVATHLAPGINTISNTTGTLIELAKHNIPPPTALALHAHPRNIATYITQNPRQVVSICLFTFPQAVVSPVLYLMGFGSLGPIARMCSPPRPCLCFEYRWLTHCFARFVRGLASGLVWQPCGRRDLCTLPKRGDGWLWIERFEHCSSRDSRCCYGCGDVWGEGEWDCGRLRGYRVWCKDHEHNSACG